MYDEKPRRADPLSVLPDPPTVCGSLGCDNKTQVQFLQVRRADNKLLTGAASDFCLDGKPVLKSDYMFHLWISRCDACYMRELRGANKHQLKNLDEKPYEQKASEYRGQLSSVLKKIASEKRVAA